MKKKLMIALIVTASIALTAGIVNAAATHNVTSQFGPEGDIYQVDGTMKMRSLMVGEQDVGGVTYFNGTIINTTTNSGADNPVTFGDNVRIDGRVYRGATAGTSDSQPFIVNDNMEVTGSLTVGNLLGTGIVSSDNISDATIATTDIADDAVTPAKINGDGGANLPIAYGYCDSNGATRGGTSNVTCSWNAANSEYRITITGEDYYYNEYVTTITTAGNNYIAETNSLGNQLIVDFEDNSGTTGLQSDFGFVVYKY